MTILYRRNKRRFPQLSSELENRLRFALYGTLGTIAALTWHPNYLFVLGHMRAGSSLLTRLLTSNPGIAGYGELHLAYHKKQDFRALVGKVLSAERKLRPNSQYVMDKLLHDYLLDPANLQILRSDRMRLIFLVRQPEQSLQSLVASFGYSPEKACDYYVGRLLTLTDYAVQLAPSKSCVALTYQDIVNRTQDTFDLLEKHLGLAEPLQEEFEIIPSNRGVDPSQNLKTGRILRNNKVALHTAQIDGNLVARGREAFDCCLNTLAIHCLTIGFTAAG
jgi:hypothetical protein